MPKKNERSKKKLHMTESDQLLVGLEKLSKTGGEVASTASSLVMWWLRNKAWTEAQWRYARLLVNKAKQEKKKTDAAKKYFVYAITDGEFIKIGFSCNTGERLKTLQTSHPKHLKCIWERYAGRSAAAAASIEKKLHRRCKENRIMGEWFKYECRHLVESFSITNEKPARHDQEALRYEN